MSDGDSFPLVPAGVPMLPAELVRIGSRHRAVVIDLMPETRLCWAVRVLFLAGFDTTDIADFTQLDEARVATLLAQAPGPARVEVVA